MKAKKKTLNITAPKRLDLFNYQLLSFRSKEHWVQETGAWSVQKVGATSAQPTDVSQVLQGHPGQQEGGPPPQNHGTGDRNT